MIYIDWSDVLLYFLFFVIVIFGLVCFYNWVDKNARIQEQIIKQSNDYIVYKECTEIQGNYYCKGVID